MGSDLRARHEPVALDAFTWNANYGTSASIDTRPHIEARMASRAGTERLATVASYGSMHQLQLVVRVGSHGVLGLKTSRNITRQHISDEGAIQVGTTGTAPPYTLCAHVCPLLQGLQLFMRSSEATPDPEVQNLCPEAPLGNDAHTLLQARAQDTP